LPHQPGEHPDGLFFRGGWRRGRRIRHGRGRARLLQVQGEIDDGSHAARGQGWRSTVDVVCRR
jgi:hypothetical protein